ncbi:putative adipose-regulatory protein-domain-containing protein [Aspergillus karnatakaensis]|uniref:seipin n=1 Tax=Aspergillus karnatakaensis TaxID=1810916 RepID=UPI003CCDBF7F
MSSDSSSEKGGDTGTSLAARTTSRLLEPLRPLVSKNALTAYVGAFLFFATATCIIFISIFAYGVFYYKLIPQAGLERSVHLQFGDGHPWGTATLDTSLISLQPYDVHVELELPRTPSNLAAGNFMLDLTLLSHYSAPAWIGGNTTAQSISHSRRPAILTYNSQLVDVSEKVSFMPLYVLGWKREAERLVVPMMEGVKFSRGANNVPETLRLELQSHHEMQVYSAKVTFRARFTGLRWIMYKWRLPSFFVFSFMFWFVSMFSFSLSWVVLACFFNVKIKQEAEEEVEEDEIKEEDESEYESESETTIKREPSEQLTLPTDEPGYEPPDTLLTPGSGQSEGSGSATVTAESAESSGVQRRRSRLFKEEDS